MVTMLNQSVECQKHKNKIKLFADAHQGLHPISSTRALLVMLFVARKEGYTLGTLSLTHVFSEVLSFLQKAKQKLQIIVHWCCKAWYWANNWPSMSKCEHDIMSSTIAHQQIKFGIGTLCCLFQPAVEFSGLKAGLQASSGTVAVSLTHARPDTQTCYESRVTALMNLQQNGVHGCDVDQLHAQALMLISSSC